MGTDAEAKVCISNLVAQVVVEKLPVRVLSANHKVRRAFSSATLYFNCKFKS